MKTERRHELQTNQLADWIGHQYDHVKPHGKTILAASILGAAVIIAGAVILQDRDYAQQTAWTDFHLQFGARDPEALADLAKRNSGTSVALWAREAQARIDLERGIAALYSNRDEAMIALADARKAFSEVIGGASSYPELMQLSLLGLAQAHEASGNLEGAREYYQQAVEKFPDSVVGKQSAARLDLIKDPQVVSFYNWFAQQKPRPSSRMSLPNLPGMPDDMTKLPDHSDLPIPPEGGPVSPPKVSPPPTTPSVTPPATTAPEQPAPPSATSPEPPPTTAPAPAAPPTPGKSPPKAPEPEKKTSEDAPKP